LRAANSSLRIPYLLSFMNKGTESQKENEEGAPDFLVDYLLGPNLSLVRKLARQGHGTTREKITGKKSNVCVFRGSGKGSINREEMRLNFSKRGRFMSLFLGKISSIRRKEGQRIFYEKGFDPYQGIYLHWMGFRRGKSGRKDE